MLKKIILKNILVGLSISIGFCGGIFLLTKAASLTATSGTPLTASNWNEMITNFFWGSGSGGIFYNGKVGIGTNSPNKSLHIYDTTNNAEIDIQSVVGAGNHWGIYQDASSQQLRLWNKTDKILISTGGALNAVGGLCMNGDCKSSWSQVVGGSSMGIYQFTGTSLTCNTLNAGKVKFSGGVFYGCDGIGWLPMASKLGTQNNPGLSCKDILDNGYSNGNGTYWLRPTGILTAFQAYCDMSTEGGGWTLLTYTNASKTLYTDGNVCLGLSSSCAGDMKRFGVTTTSLSPYTKIMIKSGDGKILIFQMTNLSYIHNIFTQGTTYSNNLYTSYIEKDTFFNHAVGNYSLHWWHTVGAGGFFISFGAAATTDDNIGDYPTTRGCGRGTNLGPLENQTTLAFYMK